MRKYTATDVMANKPICFHRIERVETVYNALMSTNHNGFPVVNEKGRLKVCNVFDGFLTRHSPSRV